LKNGVSPRKWTLCASAFRSVIVAALLVTVTFAVLPMAAPPAVALTGGESPASAAPYGYTWKDSDEADVDYFWNNITGQNTQVMNDESLVNGVSIGFDFPYYGNTYNALDISANGHVSFDSLSGNTYANLEFPDSTDFDDLICPFWDDLTGGFDLWYSTDLVASPSTFTVTWANASHFSSTDDMTFQVILYENGDIAFNYQTMVNGSGNYAGGSSASIGMENDTITGADTGLQYWYGAINGSKNFTRFTVMIYHPGAGPPPTLPADPIITELRDGDGSAFADRVEIFNRGNVTADFTPSTGQYYLSTDGGSSELSAGSWSPGAGVGDNAYAVYTLGGAESMGSDGGELAIYDRNYTITSGRVYMDYSTTLGFPASGVNLTLTDGVGGPIWGTTLGDESYGMNSTIWVDLPAGFDTVRELNDLVVDAVNDGDNGDDVTVDFIEGHFTYDDPDGNPVDLWLIIDGSDTSNGETPNVPAVQLEDDGLGDTIGGKNGGGIEYRYLVEDHFIAVDSVSWGSQGAAPDPTSAYSLARCRNVTSGYTLNWTLDLSSGQTFGVQNPSILLMPEPEYGGVMGTGTSYVRLNEINPVNGTQDWVELYCMESSPASVNLWNWRIVANGVDYTFPAVGSTIAPGGFKTADLAFSAYDNVYLFDDTGRLIDQVGWHDVTPAVGYSVLRYDDGVGGNTAYDNVTAIQQRWLIGYPGNTQGDHNWLVTATPLDLGQEAINESGDYDEIYRMTTPLSTSVDYYATFVEESGWLPPNVRVYQPDGAQEPDLVNVDDSFVFRPTVAGRYYFRVMADALESFDYSFQVNDDDTMTNFYDQPGNATHRWYGSSIDRHYNATLGEYVWQNLSRTITVYLEPGITYTIDDHAGPSFSPRVYGLSASVPGGDGYTMTERFDQRINDGGYYDAPITYTPDDYEQLVIVVTSSSGSGAINISITPIPLPGFAYADVIITELEDASGTQRVEVHNRNGTSVDILNWFFSASKLGSSPMPITSASPSTNVLDGGYRTLTASHISGLSLPAQGGTLYFFDPAGYFADVVKWGNSGPAPDPIGGDSAARVHDGSQYTLEWTWDAAPTWTAQNDVPAPATGTGGVYLNELKHDAGGFVELYSDGTSVWEDDMDYLLATPNPTPTTPFHGWNHSGANDCWQHGTPYWSMSGTTGDDDADDDDFGPTAAHSGDYCWGTNLQGGYLNNTSPGTALVASLRSPDVVLGASTTDASIRFWDWLDLQDTADDYCNVSVYATAGSQLVQVLEPSGYNRDHEWEYHDYPLTFDIGVFNTIYVRFDLYADETSETAGWFIDDFEAHTNKVDIAGWQVLADAVYTVPGGVTIGPTGGELTCYDLATSIPWTEDNVYLFDDSGVLVDMAGWDGATQGAGTVARVDDGLYEFTSYNSTLAISEGWDLDHLESRDVPNWMPYSSVTSVGAEHVATMPEDPVRDSDYERHAYHMPLNSGEKYYVIFQNQISYWAGYEVGGNHAPDLTATTDKGLVITLPDGGAPIDNSSSFTPSVSADYYFRLEGESDYYFVVHNESTMTNLYQNGTGSYQGSFAEGGNGIDVFKAYVEAGATYNFTLEDMSGDTVMWVLADDAYLSLVHKAVNDPKYLVYTPAQDEMLVFVITPWHSGFPWSFGDYIFSVDVPPAPGVGLAKLKLTELRTQPTFTVEVYNANGTAVDPTGFFISQNRDGSSPVGIGVAPMSAGDYMTTDPGWAHAEAGDVYLFDPAGTLIDEMHWGYNGLAPEPLAGETVARYWDGARYSQLWARNATSGPTLGAINDIYEPFATTGIVLNEVLFNGDTMAEFVELYAGNTGGGAASNYTAIEDNGGRFPWVDATKGTVLGGLGMSDDERDTITMPFDFTFYGNEYLGGVDIVTVTSNGVLKFGASLVNFSTDYGTGKDIPLDEGGNSNYHHLLAPFWRDLDPSATSGDVYYRVTGSAPNRLLTIEWWEVGKWFGSSETVTFEVNMQEGTNRLAFQYGWFNVSSMPGHQIGINAGDAVNYNLQADALLAEQNDRDIEFTLAGGGGLDLGGWQIVMDSSYRIPDGTTLGSGDRVYTLYESDFPAGFDMTPGADNVYLYNATGGLVDMFGWSTGHGLDASATRSPDGNGTHLGYDDDSSRAAGWNFNATPTMEAILPIITEVRWDDTLRRAEVYNPTNIQFNLTLDGWAWLGHTGSWDDGVLEPDTHATYTFTSGGDVEGLTLTLLDHASSPVATIKLGNHGMAPDPPIGHSTARYWNGTGYENAWSWDSTPTWDAASDVPLPADIPPVVLNEVLYNTDVGMDSYVELTYNPLAPELVWFMDDFEVERGWTTEFGGLQFANQWTRQVSYYNSPSTAWRIDVNEDDEFFEVDNALVSPSIDLSSSAHPMLEFWTNLSAGFNGDLEVYLKDDTGWDLSPIQSWNFETFTGLVRLDIESYGGNSDFGVKFQVSNSNPSSTHDIWTVDDVVVYEFQDLPPFWTEPGDQAISNNVTAKGTAVITGWFENAGGEWGILYGDNEYAWLESDDIAIPDDGAYLVFEHRWDQGAGDQLRLRVSESPFTVWTTLDTYTGTQATLVGSNPYDLTAYAGQTIRLNWSVIADNDGNTGNWYLDNISVKPYSDPGFNLSGYQIVVDDPANAYSIPAVVLNPLNNYFTVNETQAPGLFGELTASGDNVYLYTPGEQLLDMVGWNTPHTVNRSVARVPEGLGTYDGFNDTSSLAAGWVFDQTPTLRLVSVEADSVGSGDVGTWVWYNLTVTNHGPSDTITITWQSDLGWAVGLFEEDGSTVLANPFTLGMGETKGIVVKVQVGAAGAQDTTRIWATPSANPVGRDNATLLTNSYCDLVILPASILVLSTEMRVSAGTSPAAGVPAWINVTVRNVGHSGADDVLVRIWDTDGAGDQVYFGAGTIASIPAGGQATVNVTGRPYKWGTNLFVIKVDPDDSIPETNELNNQATHSEDYDYLALSSGFYDMNVTMNLEMQYVAQQFSSGALLTNPFIFDQSSMIFRVNGTDYITSDADLSAYVVEEPHVTTNTSAEMTYLFPEGVEAVVRIALANEDMARVSVEFTNYADAIRTAGFRQYFSLYNDAQDDWVVYHEDFDGWEGSPHAPGWENASNPINGWDHSGVNDSWTFGIPLGDDQADNDTQGPLGDSETSAGYCWGTNADWKASFSGAYGNSTSSGAVLTATLNSTDIDLHGVAYATLEFREWLDLDVEGSTDDRREILVKDAADNSTLDTLVAAASNQANFNWTLQSFSLDQAVCGRTVYLQFNLYTNDADVDGGWFIDNVTITAHAEESIAWVSTEDDPNTLIEYEADYTPAYAFDSILFHTFYDPLAADHFAMSRINSSVYVGSDGGNTPPDLVQLVNGSHLDAHRTWAYATDGGDGLYANGPGSRVATALRWEPVTLESYFTNPGASQLELVSHFGTANVNPLPPDLSIVESQVKLGPQGPVEEGTLVYINASIYNVGGTASTSFKVEIWDGEPGSGTLIDDAIVSSLDPYGAEAAEVFTTWIATGDGLHYIYVVVDTLAQITEVSELNNQAMNAIEVNGTPVVTVNDVPKPVLNLSMSVDGSDHPVLTWELQSEPTNRTRDSIRIFRSADRLGFDFTIDGPQQVASLGNSTLTWTDFSVSSGTHYYYVRTRNVIGLSSLSTMGVYHQFSFTYNAGIGNDNWISMPHDSDYVMASDIVLDIEGALSPGGVDVYINYIGKWDPATQGVTEAYFYQEVGPPALWGWNGGADFAINPGDSITIQLSGNTASFTWSVAGTDVRCTRDFTYNAGIGNDNWITVPWTGQYTLASDIVNTLEGGTGSGTDVYINYIGKWDPATQGVTEAYFYQEVGPPALWGWNGGADFAIAPGDGITIQLSGNTANFNWLMALVSNPVPDSVWP